MCVCSLHFLKISTFASFDISTRGNKDMIHASTSMRKYKYLNNDNAHPRDVAYKAKDVVGKYIFQRSSLDIFYLVCDTVEEFYRHYSRKEPHSRMYNEVINGTQKFKLDIDGRIDTNAMEYVLRTIRKLFRKLTKKCKPEILVYNISTSHHIIVANICFPSAMCCEMLATAISEKVSKKFPTAASLMDIGVYKQIQMFRVEGSTKYKQRRWKYLEDTTELSSLETFKKGIVTFVDDCYFIDAERVIDTMLDMGIYKPDTSRERKMVKESEKRIPKEFTIRKTLKNLTVLDRIASSLCPICKRVHDRENAYMVGGKLFCFRNF